MSEVQRNNNLKIIIHGLRLDDYVRITIESLKEDGVKVDAIPTIKVDKNKKYPLNPKPNKHAPIASIDLYNVKKK